MAGTRVNLAVTKDGGSYNKLQRPTDYLSSTPPTKDASERKRIRDVATGEDAAGNKRAKTEHSSQAIAASNGKMRAGGPLGECGMYSTFSLDLQDYEEEERTDDMRDALAYLQGVKSEALAIPRLLGGPKDGRSAARHSTANQRVLCQDGAWFAIDEENDHVFEDEDSEQQSRPQEGYYKQLLKRFQALRNAFLEMKSQGLPQRQDPAADQSHTGPPRSRHDWHCTIEREYPRPFQILKMDERAILKGLVYCAHAIDRFDTISSQKSCWIWSLLACLSDSGALDHWKMGQVRDVGCKAGQLGAKLRRGITLHSYTEEGVGEKRDTQSDKRSTGQDVEKGEVGLKVVTPAHTPHEPEHTKAYVDKTQKEEPSEVRGNVQTQALSEDAVGDSEAEMSISEDEKRGDSDDEAVDLEKARARLLAQLGDRLVQPGIHTSEQHSHELGESQHRDGQAAHNIAHEQYKPTTRSFPSRVEAERQRQQMRGQELRKEAERDKSRAQRREAKASGGDQSHSMTAVDLNTRVTIDMILTVVAECYGQKDLLKFRGVW